MPRLAPVTSAVVPVRSIPGLRARRAPAINDLVALPLRTDSRCRCFAPPPSPSSVCASPTASALIAAPEQLALRWLGPAAGTPPAQVPLRGLGAREIVVHGAAIAAALRELPLRPFLAASVAGDLADIAATVAGRRGLPDGAAPATLAVAGGSALLTAALAAAVER